jgi:NAD(P)-dependent dehydrogenase (short-subunit alcohol dehydrogenase family)
MPSLAAIRRRTERHRPCTSGCAATSEPFATVVPFRSRGVEQLDIEVDTTKPVAIITGGASGMGLATARVMGRDHRVVIADLDRARLDAAAAELSGDGVEVVGEVCDVCDVTDRASVDALFATARASGRLRAVVHAAGVSPQMGSAALIVRVNAVGTVHVAEAALAVASEGFAVVNVASFAAHAGPSFLEPRRTFRLAMTDPERMGQKLTSLAERLPSKLRSGAAYSLSKAFVVWYSARAAAAFGARGARILSVSPGSIDTPMGRLEEASGSGRLPELAAIKRFGRPEELAEVLAFCASDKPGYLTGVDILCDGGTKAGMRLRDMLALARDVG